MAHDAYLPPADPPAAVPLEGRRPGGRQAALIFIFVAVTIDTISMGITAPVLPLLIEHMAGGADAGLMNGLFMAVFALMQFIFSPILGALSDRYGRRPILLLSIAAMGLSYAAMGMATSIWQLLLIRTLTGATSANIATAFAYIADVTPADRRAGAYGMMQAAMSLGFAMGPAIGGFFTAFGASAPFWAAACFSLINAAYGFFVVPESLALERRAPFRLREMASFGALRILTSKPGIMRMALILALAQFAVMVFPTTFVLYAKHRYGWNIVAVTACLTAFGVCSAIVQLGLSGRVVRMFGEVRVAVGGLGCGVLGLLAFGLAPTGLAFAAAIPIMTLWGVAAPAVQSLMTRLVSSSEQGRLQGANTSLGSLGSVISPLLFGYLYSQVYRAVQGGAGSVLLGAPFLLASAIVVLAAGLAAAPMRVRRLRA